jgi:hypothetical protein
MSEMGIFRQLQLQGAYIATTKEKGRPRGQPLGCGFTELEDNLRSQFDAASPDARLRDICRVSPVIVDQRVAEGTC